MIKACCMLCLKVMNDSCGSDIVDGGVRLNERMEIGKIFFKLWDFWVVTIAVPVSNFNS